MTSTSPVSATTNLSPEVAAQVDWLSQTLKESEESFSPAKSDEGFVSFKKDIGDGSGVLLIKAHLDLPGISAREADLMMNEFPIRKLWDEVVDEMELVKKLDAHTDLVYYNIPPPGFMVARREFLSKRTRLGAVLDHSFVTLERFTEDECKPETSGFVRAKILNSGSLISETADGCKITLLVQVDIGGWVPQWVVNLKADDGPYQLWKALKEKHPKLKREGRFDTSQN